MPGSTIKLIDPEAVAALLGGLDAETQEVLLTAVSTDTMEWTERLVAAWSDGDREAQRRAVHSLRGICGSFGMTVLQSRYEGDLSEAVAINALRHCRDASLSALRAAVPALQ
ncbi:MAG: Hpt domain-containing protein [Novosphingobium sp.]|nr:Hpt domain-containing protein [Novosphingobium sp.]